VNGTSAFTAVLGATADSGRHRAPPYVDARRGSHHAGGMKAHSRRLSAATPPVIRGHRGYDPGVGRSNVSYGAAASTEIVGFSGMTALRSLRDRASRCNSLPAVSLRSTADYARRTLPGSWIREQLHFARDVLNRRMHRGVGGGVLQRGAGMSPANAMHSPAITQPVSTVSKPCT
jgi:hypothetical protein